MTKNKAAGMAVPSGSVEGNNEKSLKNLYQVAPLKSTADLGDWRSIGELSRDVLVTCFTAKYRIRPSLGRAVFELAGYGRAA